MEQAGVRLPCHVLLHRRARKCNERRGAATARTLLTLETFINNYMNLVQFTNQVVTTGGATYNITTGTTPTSGYGSSMEDHVKVHSLPESWDSMASDEKGMYVKQYILDFIASKGLMLESSWDYIEATIHEGDIILNVTRVFDDLYDAVLFGILNNQAVIYDFNRDESIEIPEGQKHGTMTQAMDYAKMTATAITNHIIHKVI